MSQVINAQPPIIRDLLSECTFQTLKDGTICYWSALKISEDQLNQLKVWASLLIPQIGHYAKAGEGFEWSAKIIFQVDGSAICSFVFNDYENVRS